VIKNSNKQDLNYVQKQLDIKSITQWRLKQEAASSFGQVDNDSLASICHPRGKRVEVYSEQPLQGREGHGMSNSNTFLFFYSLQVDILEQVASVVYKF
jgi:hypothetical protein